MDAAIIGALAALFGVMLGQLVSSRSEHKKWLRDQSFAACVDLLHAVDSLKLYLEMDEHLRIEGTDHDLTRINELYDQMVISRNRVLLTCAKRVGHAAANLTVLAATLPSINVGSADASSEQILQFEKAHTAFLHSARDHLLFRSRISVEVRDWK